MIGRALRSLFKRLRSPFANMLGLVDFRDKIVLIDNDELLLVWEPELRNKRLALEEDAWKRFEAAYGTGSPEITAAFVKWQEKLYAHIEQEKDRFLAERAGTRAALYTLLRAGVKVVAVTKGAKPYTQKCFTLLGLSSLISDIFSPGPGSRKKRFRDAAFEYGKNTSWKWLRDVIVVGHDLEHDMAWELVPPKGGDNDGKAPVLVLFDALRFGADVAAPLDALPEIMTLLARKGKNHFLRGFKAIDKPEKAVTTHYSFNMALYRNPKQPDKARIPVIYDIKRRR